MQPSKTDAMIAERIFGAPICYWDTPAKLAEIVREVRMTYEPGSNADLLAALQLISCPPDNLGVPEALEYCEQIARAAITRAKQQ